MARKIASKASAKATPRKEITITELVQQIIENPTVRFVVSGLAATFLTKVTTKLASRYPQITNLIKENLPDIEQKFQKNSKEFSH